MNTRLIYSLLALAVSSVFSLADPVRVAASPSSETLAQATPSPYVRFKDTGVVHVKNERRPTVNPDMDQCVARRDDMVCIYVQHLNQWINDPLNKDRIPTGSKIADLVPYLDDVPLKGIHPELSWAAPEVDAEDWPQVHFLRFTLNRSESSKSAWMDILNRPHFSKPMKVSVGFENGEEIPTFVEPTASKTKNQFIFTVIPPLRFWLGAALILGAFFLFLYLARWTDIIRDTEGTLRPDKRWPYSLSRTQMAFWFFLVVGAFFFLWVILGDTDTLNPSVLGLIGISAGTALGAAFVDSGKKTAPPSESDLPAVNLSQPRQKICAEIAKLISTAKEELKQIETARAAIDPKDEAKLADNAAAQANKTQQITDLQRQLDYFEWPAWKGMMFDLLAENNVICFHRFQIFIWTIVLGIMFVANVYSKLAMPEFSATLLGLLGISAGTYVGFKIPENKARATA